MNGRFIDISSVVDCHCLNFLFHKNATVSIQSTIFYTYLLILTTYKFNTNFNVAIVDVIV